MILLVRIVKYFRRKWAYAYCYTSTSYYEKGEKCSIGVPATYDGYVYSCSECPYRKVTNEEPYY